MKTFLRFGLTFIMIAFVDVMWSLWDFHRAKASGGVVHGALGLVGLLCIGIICLAGAMILINPKG